MAKTTQFGLDAISEATVTRYLQKLGLKMPPIPSKLEGHLKKLKPDLFGTHSEVTPVYDINAYVKEALYTPTPSYVLFGLGGHGILTQAMHYYCVTDKIAVFYQLSFGMPTLDPEFAKNRVNAAFYGVNLLFHELDKSHQIDLIPIGRRLLVVESDYYGRGWGWIDGFPGAIDPNKWNTQDPIILSALNAIPS
jgi:hypothetical protein